MRDDIWSLFYIIIEMLTGTLPWRGRERDITGELKSDWMGSRLVDGLSPSLLAFSLYLEGLGYESIPNYDLIHDWIRDIGGHDTFPGIVPYDWDVPVSVSPVKEDIHPVVEIALAEGGPVRRSRGIFTPFVNLGGRAGIGGRSGGRLEPTPPTSEPRMHLRSRRYIRG
jgi:serine/threonine protein kinase